ncbi:MAG TPA: sugar-binding protein [Rhabdochlamydiaceae bacterium]|nr:sugar-binding protein [Rhabdochlamydiaceae bacterium]
MSRSMAADDFLSRVEPLLPIDFFNLSADAVYSKSIPVSKISKSFYLPDTSDLLSEEKFADAAMAWNREGVLIRVNVNVPFEECFFPNYDKGDSVELFFDTRDLKTAGFATRFCHHFVFLPQEVQGIKCKEVTHFRSEDSHLLCNPDELECTTHFERSGYQMRISIPSHCLHGYDPSSFDRLGFTYQINRSGGAPQHFAISSHYYNVEQNPSRWCSLKLISTTTTAK